MTRLQRLLRPAPALVGGGALALCAGMLIANMILGVVAHDYQIRFWSHPAFAALNGVTGAMEKRKLTLQTAFDGSFQSVYARSVGSHVPVFTFAVRVRNQLMFSLFGTSATPDVLVGAGKELVERAYVEDYCSRNLATFLPEARVWATQIRQMQDLVERQGKTFLYVLTPSKVAQYPSFLPPGMPCPSTAADRAGIVPAWLTLMREAGVHVVDTTAVVTQAHGRYPFALYPNGGTHWNAVGATLAGQAVVAALGARRPGFPQVGFRWHMADEPTGIDMDLASLMNLLWWPNGEPVPETDLIEAPAPASCAAPSVLIIGGSFGHAIGELLSREPCHPVVAEYEYWHLLRLEWQDGKTTFTALDENQRARDLAAADIILYEDNEQMLGRSLHGKALFNYLTHPAPPGETASRRE